jgi:hypothetical protein
VLEELNEVMHAEYFVWHLVLVAVNTTRGIY